jgi:hypothetical protein
MHESIRCHIASVGSFLFLVAVVCALPGCLISEAFETPPKPVSNWTVAEARQFQEFPLYWLGESYHGLPLTAIRIAGPAYTHDHVHVTFGYGDPSLLGGAPSQSWQFPLEIDIYHRCDNLPEKLVPHFGEYSDDEEISTPEIQGVDTYIVRYPAFDYLFMWSGESAIFPETWETDFDIEQIARDLIPIASDGGAPPGQLPPPVSAAC